MDLVHATQVPQNGTFPFSMTGLNLNGWGLPLSCQFSIGYDKAGNMSAGFVLDEQTEAAVKTWGPTALAATATAAPTSSQTGAATAATTTPSSSPSSTATGNAPVATSSATSAGGGGGGGLSPGAAAGVGVGCTIIGLGLLGLLIWFIRRWRKRWAIAVIRRGDGGAKEKQEADMGGRERSNSFGKPEMNADQTRYEMPEGYAMPKELGGRERHYELSGAERRRELEGG